jgi:hypothetical protein
MNTENTNTENTNTQNMNSENIDELMNFNEDEFLQMDNIFTNSQQYILGNRSPVSITNIEQFEIPSRPKLRRQFAIIINQH